jgi:hypothetical protein
MPSHLVQGDWCYVTPEIDTATVSLHTAFTLGIPITNAGDEASTSSSSVHLRMFNNDTNESIDRSVQPPHDLAPGDTGHGTVHFGAGELTTGTWHILVYGEGGEGGNADFHGGGIAVVDDRSHAVE